MKERTEQEKRQHIAEIRRELAGLTPEELAEAEAWTEEDEWFDHLVRRAIASGFSFS